MVAFALTAAAATAFTPLVVSPVTSLRQLLVPPIAIPLPIGSCGSFAILAIRVTLVLVSPGRLLVPIIRIAVAISFRWFLLPAIRVTLAIIMFLRRLLDGFSGRLVGWRRGSYVTRA